MGLDLPPGGVVRGGRVAAPAAAAVGMARPMGHRLLDRVPRRPDPAAHGIDYLGGIDFDLHLGRADRPKRAAAIAATTTPIRKTVLGRPRLDMTFSSAITVAKHWPRILGPRGDVNR